MKELGKRTEALMNEFLSKSRGLLSEAEELFKKYEFPLAVERAQESIEFSLKSLFLLLGKDYPKDKDHDVGKHIPEILDDLKAFPSFLIWEKIPSIKLGSKTLSVWKQLAAYGDERIKASPKTIFGEHEAKFAIESTKETFHAVNGCYTYYRGEIIKQRK